MVAAMYALLAFEKSVNTKIYVLGPRCSYPGPCERMDHQDISTMEPSGTPFSGAGMLSS